MPNLTVIWKMLRFYIGAFFCFFEGGGKRKMGLDRRRRSEDSSENKYIIILATLYLIYPLTTFLQMSPMAIFLFVLSVEVYLQ